MTDKPPAHHNSHRRYSLPLLSLDLLLDLGQLTVPVPRQTDQLNQQLTRVLRR